MQTNKQTCLLQISQRGVTEQAKGCIGARILIELASKASSVGMCKGPLIQLEKYFSKFDNCFCDTKQIQSPSGDSVTEGSGRTVTAKDPLIELSAVADMRSHPHCDFAVCDDVSSETGLSTLVYKENK